MRKSINSMRSDYLQMRLLYPDSTFLDKCYDPAIVGYDSVTGAVIYDDENMLNLSMGMFEPNKHPDIITWGEQFEFCISQIQSMFCQDCPDGMVPPILMTVFPEDYLSDYIADLHPDGDP